MAIGRIFPLIPLLVCFLGGLFWGVLGALRIFRQCLFAPGKRLSERRSVRILWAVARFFSDFFFALFGGVLYTVLIFYTEYGVIRWYSVAAFLGGFAAAERLTRRRFRSFLTRAASAGRRGLAWCFSPIRRALGQHRTARKRKKAQAAEARRIAEEEKKENRSGTRLGLREEIRKEREEMENRSLSTEQAKSDLTPEKSAGWKTVAVLWRTLALILLGLSMVVFGTRLMQYNELKKQEDAYDDQIEQTEEKIEELQHAIENTSDEEYVIKVAREKLKLFFPDEKIYYGEE